MKDIFDKPVDTQPTIQQQIVSRFSRDLDEIESFVILAHTKSGKMRVYPCVDKSLGPWLFVDAFRTKANEEICNRLFGPPSDIGPSFA
jgi:hypothetical protein